MSDEQSYWQSMNGAATPLTLDMLEAAFAKMHDQGRQVCGSEECPHVVSQRVFNGEVVGQCANCGALVDRRG